MCQRTIFSANLRDPRQANGLQRPRSPASKRPSAATSGSWASKRPSAPTSEILGKQTTCSADCEESWPAKRYPAPTSRILGQQTLQRQPPGSSASKRQRQPRGSLSRKQALAATSHIAKLPAQSANQAPISLASGSLVCEFVHQIASV